MRGTRKPIRRIRRHTQSDAWDDFVQWCQRRELVAVPANPWTLAAYVRALEPHQTPRAIAKAVKDIARVHEEKTRKRIDRDPLVTRTLNMIENRRKTDKTESSRIDLFDEPPTKPKPKKKAKPKAETPSRVKRGLSATPRLVSRRRLTR